MEVPENPKHSGSKYYKEIQDIEGNTIGVVDVYSVLYAYNVTNPALQHAIKKLLCAGLRNKGSFEQDCQEAKDAVEQARRFNR